MNNNNYIFMIPQSKINSCDAKKVLFYNNQNLSYSISVIIFYPGEFNFIPLSGL